MPKYGIIKGVELITSESMLQDYKPIEYERLPIDFNQETHYVTQTKPVEEDNHIYIGIEIHELETKDEGFEDELL